MTDLEDSNPKSVLTNCNDVKIPADNKYVVLCETSGEEMESWYYFIRYGNNKEALEYLLKQFNSVDMYVIDDLSSFDLDLDHFFSESTAKEMIRLEVNTMYHRKFDGILKLVNFGFKKRDNNDKKLERINDALCGGNIDKYVSGEDTEGCSNYNSENESFSGEDESDSTDEELFPLPEDKKSSEKPAETPAETPAENNNEEEGAIISVKEKSKVPAAIQMKAGRRGKEKKRN